MSTGASRAVGTFVLNDTMRLPVSSRFALGIAGFTICEKGALAVPAVLVAVTVKSNVPSTSGVPEMPPVFAFSVMPSGKLPAEMVKVIGIAPVAVMVAPGAAEPAVAAGNAAAGPVIAGGAGGGGAGLGAGGLEPPPPPPPQATSRTAAPKPTSPHGLRMEILPTARRPGRPPAR